MRYVPLSDEVRFPTKICGPWRRAHSTQKNSGPAERAAVTISPLGVVDSQLFCPTCRPRLSPILSPRKEVIKHRSKPTSGMGRTVCQYRDDPATFRVMLYNGVQLTIAQS